MRGYRHSINQLQTPPTPPLPRKNVLHARCTLYSMPSQNAVLARQPVQCSMLCMLLCDPAAFACYTQCHVVDSMDADANCALYAGATVQKLMSVNVCGCELAGGEEALPDLVHYRYTMHSHCSTVTLHIVQFAGGFPYTIQSTLSAPVLGAFSFVHFCIM